MACKDENCLCKQKKKEKMETDPTLEQIKSDKQSAQEELIAKISEYNPNAILLEPRRQYDHAIIGYDIEGRVVYCIEQILGILVHGDGMNDEEAWEYFDYNIRGTFEGMENPNRPILMYEY